MQYVFWRNCCFKANVFCILRIYAPQASRMEVGERKKFPRCYLILNKIVTSQGIIVKIRNIQIHKMN